MVGCIQVFSWPWPYVGDYPKWDPAKVYNTNDMVSYIKPGGTKLINYRAKADSRGVLPTNTNMWASSENYTTFYMDGTSHFCGTDPTCNTQVSPDTCDLDHNPPYDTWCQGRNWDSKVVNFTVTGTDVLLVDRNPYQRMFKYKPGAHVVSRSCPGLPNVTNDIPPIPIPTHNLGCFNEVMDLK